jgi:hypothetical protein
MTGIKDEDLNGCMNALKLLYQITGRDEAAYGQERESYFAVLEKMTYDSGIHAGLNGCIQGILYGSGREQCGSKTARGKGKGYPARKIR